MRQPTTRTGGPGRSIVIGLIAFLTAGAIAEQLGQVIVARRYAPPGQLVDLGDRRLHLHCMGDGDVTIVLEAGLGGDSTSWYAVQPALASLTRVCSYDRAGYGWSDPLPGERTIDQLVTDLRLLLVAAGIEGPCVLVGHSLGGLLVRMYQAAYPEQVLGLVLVDSSHESASERAAALGLPSHRPYGFKDILGVVFSYVGGTRLILKAVEPFGDDVPPDRARQMAAIKAKPVTMAAQFTEMRRLHDYFAAAQVAGGNLEHVPMIVMAALGGRVEDEQAFWLELQQELASRSKMGELWVVAEGRHHLHWARPATVVEAVRDVLEQVQ